MSSATVSQPDFPRIANLPKTAAGLRARLAIGQEQSAPLSVIIDALGYEALFFDPRTNPKFAEVSAATDYKRRKIFLNLDDSPQRRRFALAQQIAHICLHDDGQGCEIDSRNSLESSESDSEHTAEAKRFAAELVMPNALFADRYFYHSGNVEKIANVFSVTPAAVKIRLRTFNFDA